MATPRSARTGSSASMSGLNSTFLSLPDSQKNMGYNGGGNFTSSLRSEGYSNGGGTQRQSLDSARPRSTPSRGSQASPTSSRRSLPKQHATPRSSSRGGSQASAPMLPPQQTPLSSARSGGTLRSGGSQPSAASGGMPQQSARSSSRSGSAVLLQQTPPSTARSGTLRSGMQASSRSSAASPQGAYPLSTARSNGTTDTSVYGYVHLPGYGGHQPDSKRNAGKLGKSFSSETASSYHSMYAPESRSVGVGAHLASEIKKEGIPFHEFESHAATYVQHGRFLPQEGYSGHMPRAPRNQAATKRHQNHMKSLSKKSSGSMSGHL